MPQEILMKNKRIINKHDTEANWKKAKNFIPLQAEIIVYDAEIDAEGNLLELPEGRTTPYTYERIKMGDGKTKVNDLPFIDENKQDKFAKVGTLISEDGSVVYETRITLPQAYTSYIDCPGYFEINADSYLGLKSANEAPVSVNGVYFWPNGEEGYINNLNMPENADGHYAVNKEYVDTLFANSGGGIAGGQVKFAEVTSDEYSQVLNINKPTIFAGSDYIGFTSDNNAPVELNKVYFFPTANDLGTITNLHTETEGSPYDAVNREYIANIIGNINVILDNIIALQEDLINNSSTSTNKDFVLIDTATGLKYTLGVTNSKLQLLKEEE